MGLATPGLAVAGLGALGVALMMSPQVPIGMARTFELHPGVKVDPPVLVAGAAGRSHARHWPRSPPPSSPCTS